MQRFECFPSHRPTTPLLDQVDAPAALQSLSSVQLRQLADELRAFLLYEVGRHGGHLGAGLGVVELTIALHRHFSAAEDRLVWDVGHQAYPHKILTGRREQMGSIRQWQGLAPFPSRQESPFDAFGVGHAGTAVSAALGIVLSRRVLNQPGRACAILGDGALSCGMSFEALSHAGAERADLTVILNDNGMSISPNVGAVAEHLAGASSSEMTAAFFNMMGFAYSGLIDGHDIDAILVALNTPVSPSGPRLLHVVTRKGAGFIPAEEDALAGHSHSVPAASRVPPSVQRSPSVQQRSASSEPTLFKSAAAARVPDIQGVSLRYQEVFGQWMCQKAAQDQRLVAITPAMSEGAGLATFAQQFSARFIDVAIAEQHALTLAAGMATEGAKPVVAIYSTFLQRGYDQLIHDIALQQLDVTLAVDRAGLVGEDGPTHHGAFDISYLRAIPHLVVIAAADDTSLIKALDFAYNYAGPCAVRYPRGRAVSVFTSMSPEMVLGQGVWIYRRESPIALLNFGGLLPEVVEAAHTLNASVVDMRFIKPLDSHLLAEVAAQHAILVTIEDNVITGGAGSAVAEALSDLRLQGSVHGEVPAPRLIRLGLPDDFIGHGSRETLLEQVGLSVSGIVRQVQEHLSRD